jgi:hypothetical protein
LGDLATRSRDWPLVWRTSGTSDIMAVARASPTLAPPKPRTYSSPNFFLNASLLPDLLNSSKSFNISWPHRGMIVWSYSASLSVDQLRRTQTSFKIVLELRQEPLEPVNHQANMSSDHPGENRGETTHGKT